MTSTAEKGNEAHDQIFSKSSMVKQLWLENKGWNASKLHIYKFHTQEILQSPWLLPELLGVLTAIR
jgi:hypothetical protein